MRKKLAEIANRYGLSLNEYILLQQWWFNDLSSKPVGVIQFKK